MQMQKIRWSDLVDLVFQLDIYKWKNRER